MNQFIFSGRLTKDPEIRYIPEEEKYVANISVAQSIGKKKEDGTRDPIYFECSIWQEEIINMLRSAGSLKGAKVVCEATVIPKTKKDKDDKWQKSTSLFVYKIDINPKYDETGGN